jgi:FeS assembly SUF system protein
MTETPPTMSIPDHITNPVAPAAPAPKRDMLDLSPPVPEAAAKPSELPQEELDRITDDLITAFKTVYDPEIPVDIYELGLIYKVDLKDDGHVEIEMTLTAPACPAAGELPISIEDAAKTVEGVRSAKAIITFDPPWHPGRMSDEAKLALNML